MPSLVERTREVVSAESDDYFADDTILFYLNKTQQKLAAYYINLEERSEQSLRVLDSLRQHLDISVNGITFTDEGDYFTAEVPFPSSPDEINKFMFLKYDQSGVMRELTYNNRLQLEWGNLKPTSSELYYMVTQDSGGNVIFQIFTNADDSATSKDVRVYYIKNPTDLALADDSMEEFPTRLENALVYGAAKLMVTQESITDEKGQQATQIFTQQYQEELSTNAY